MIFFYCRVQCTLHCYQHDGIGGFPRQYAVQCCCCRLLYLMAPNFLESPNGCCTLLIHSVFSKQLHGYTSMHRFVHIVTCTHKLFQLHTGAILTAIFPGEPGLANCPLIALVPFITKLCSASFGRGVNLLCHASTADVYVNPHLTNMCC